MAIFGFKNPFRNSSAIKAAANAARDNADWTKAAEQYEKYLLLQSDDDRIWVQLGHARKEAGDTSGALSAYLRALSLAPKVADTHLMLGHLRKTMGDLSQAAACYADAVACDPDALDPLMQLAFAEKDLGHDDAAVTHFKAILQLDPSNQEVIDLVRTLSRSANRTTSASAHANKDQQASTSDNLSRTTKAMTLELRRLQEKIDDSDKAVLRLETTLAGLQRDVRANYEATESRLIKIETQSPLVSQKFQALLDHVDALQKKPETLMKDGVA